MTDEPSVHPLVAAEYQALADLLAAADESDWSIPSLCEGWRVREVVAHLTMPARYDDESFLEELRARDFDFGRLSNDIAERDARLETGSLLADLRSESLARWTPPGGGNHGALNHVVVHGLDVTVSLGHRRRPPGETMRVVLDDLTVGGGHEHFATDIAGRRFEASDLDWSFGSGRALRGEAADLVLVLSGRTVPADRLDGDPL